MTYVLYHNNCRDGFGAAWAAWRHFGEDGVKYLPVSYGDTQWRLPEDAAIVYALDFCFERHQTEAIAKTLEARGGAFFVIDHHDTRMREHEGLAYCHFDLTRSGAVLAWEHFHRGLAVPRLLLYVEDRDLWTFALPASRAVSAWLDTRPRAFGAWTQAALELMTDQGLARTMDVGSVLLEQQVSYVERVVKNASIGTVLGHSVPVVNSGPNLQSEVGEALLAKYPDADFSAAYFDIHGTHPKRFWSLRARKGSAVHVGDIAVQVTGGGGHQGASGFQTTVNGWYRNDKGDTVLACLL